MKIEPKTLLGKATKSVIKCKLPDYSCVSPILCLFRILSPSWKITADAVIKANINSM